MEKNELRENRKEVIEESKIKQIDRRERERQRERERKQKGEGTQGKGKCKGGKTY
jgi:hypothetical protein